MKASRKMPKGNKNIPRIKLYKKRLHQMSKLSPDNATGLKPAESTQSSTHRTISTPELFEHILSYLSPFELSHTRRVNTFFRNTIDHSLPLQKNLFLRPCAPARLEASDGSVTASSRHYAIHPLLNRTTSNPKSVFETDLYVAPFPGELHGQLELYTLHQLTQTFEDASGLSNSDDSPLHRMYLTNPPVKRVEKDLDR